MLLPIKNSRPGSIERGMPMSMLKREMNVKIHAGSTPISATRLNSKNPPTKSAQEIIPKWAVCFTRRSLYNKLGGGGGGKEKKRGKREKKEG